ncbi:MAG: transglutaminase family protein [Candidatus Magnetomorum sp.]|nr:transglutaminase family protein [Candidatus Magnetomorum sp.]
MTSRQNFDLYLQPTAFIDSDHPQILDFVNDNIAQKKDPKSKAIRLFYAVRDQILYDPYTFNLKPERLTASYVRLQKSTFCIPKAILMTAVLRAAGIPARLGFADLVNHSMGEELKKVLKTNLLAWHGYVELFLDERWVKATPAFNAALCQRLNVSPVEFDGETHAVFPDTDNNGNRHMEYLRYHGTFSDVPLDMIVESMKYHYPMLKEHDELV